MRRFRGFATAMTMATLWIARSGLAQKAELASDSRSGLPGVMRVPMLTLQAPRVTAAVDAGYGYTESQSTESAHHRALGSLGIGIAPVPWLEFGLLNGLRYDWHPNDGAGADGGTIGQVSMLARVGTHYGRAFRFGADVGAAFPGSERLSSSLRSPAIDLRALLGWLPPAGIRYAGYAGFRIDRTSGVGQDAPRYRAGDRLVVGLSDFNAVVLGVGIVLPIDRFELLGELTGDLLVGHRAPPLLQSPLRANVGLRRAFTGQLSAELMSEWSLSARPTMASDAPLIPVEARFSLVLGLRYRIGAGAPTGTVKIPVQGPAKPIAITSTADPAPATPSATTDSARPDTESARVTVYDSAGHPLSDASVSIEAQSGTITLGFENGSTFTVDSVPVGTVRVKVRAELMREWEQAIVIERGTPVDLRVDMVAADISAQIRGLVRGFDGTSLPARIQIEPGEHEVQVGPNGAFSVDVSPGKYRVRVLLQGYQSQERVVEVGKNGVTVLNVDLQKVR